MLSHTNTVQTEQSMYFVIHCFCMFSWLSQQLSITCHCFKMMCLRDNIKNSMKDKKLKEARGYKNFRKKSNICFSLQFFFISFCSCYFIIWYKNHSKQSIRVGPRWLSKCIHHWKSSKLSPFGGKMPFFGSKIEISFSTHRWPIFFNIISI